MHRGQVKNDQVTRRVTHHKYGLTDDDDSLSNEIFTMFIGARLAGGDLTKNGSSTHASNQPLFATGTRRTSKTVDSLDLENVLHPKWALLSRIYYY